MAPSTCISRRDRWDSCPSHLLETEKEIFGSASAARGRAAVDLGTTNIEFKRELGAVPEVVEYELRSSATPYAVVMLALWALYLSCFSVETRLAQA